jgi:hypothetical protein
MIFTPYLFNFKAAGTVPRYGLDDSGSSPGGPDSYPMPYTMGTGSFPSG